MLNRIAMVALKRGRSRAPTEKRKPVRIGFAFAAMRGRFDGTFFVRVDVRAHSRVDVFPCSSCPP
ncbi:MAG TPA: hypothetical protein VHD62_04600 [Opitutaceae bacterium]|nr:hypothetical protein [Opitutaceae bacterium]